MDFVVSIINFRTPQMTLECVQSVLAHRGSHDVRVVVVDNLSGDGSVPILRDGIAALGEVPVTLVTSATNSGFSGGHNQGIAAVPGAGAYVLLNSDALVRPGMFDALAHALTQAPRTGVFGCRIEDQAGVPQTAAFRAPSPLSELDRGARTGALTRMLARWVVPLGPNPDPADIDWVSFACVTLRGEMLRQLGPLDEGFFMYFEDVDYCLRAQKAGWGVAHVPGALIMHEEGGSGDVVNARAEARRMPRYYYASRARLLARAHGRAGLWGANLLWHLGRGVAQARRLVGRPVPPAADREWRDIWTNAARPLAGPRYAPGE